MLFRNRQIKTNLPSCLNCNKVFLDETERFCSTCGQLRTDGRIRFLDFVKDAFQDIFDLDGRIWLTIRDLLIPAKLTRQFFAGRHNTYYKPVRLFFSLMVLHFAALGFMLNNVIQEGDGVNLDALMSKNTQEALMAKQVLDSIRLNLQPSSPLNRELDSLGIRLGVQKVLSDSNSITLFDVPNLKIGKKFKIAAIDMQDTALSVIVDKYNLQGFDKYYITQIIKIERNPTGAFRYLMGNLVWMVLMMIPALALLMKLLYIRSSKYYVEHMVFQYHYHAFAFFVLGLCFLFQMDGTAFSLAFMLVLIYFFLALKWYYRQGFFKTLLKFSILNSAYLIFFGLFISITALISLILF